MTTHAIHALTFDLSVDTTDRDGARYAHWIQSMLLPIIDEVVAQQALQANIDQHHIARIQKLELDLGDVSVEMSEMEIGRRLRAQLSAALFEQLGLNRQAKERVAEEMDESQNELLQFLKEGRISWEKSGNSRHGHKSLVQEAINSPRFTELLDGLSRQPQQLLRLVRQFDHSDLFLLLRQKMRTWANEEKELCLDWLSLELSMHDQKPSYIENLWLFMFQRDTSNRSRFNELSKDWYQQLGQDPAKTMSDYETTIDQAQTLTRLGRLGEQECKETLRKLHQHLKVYEPKRSNQPTAVDLAVDSLQSIFSALNTNDFASLRTHWSAILYHLPQTLRSLHQSHWPSWLHHLDTVSALELVSVLQPQCQWVVEKLVAQAKTKSSPDEYQALVQYALPMPADSLNATDLISVWEEALQSPLALRLLNNQLQAFAIEFAEEHRHAPATNAQLTQNQTQAVSDELIQAEASRAEIKQAIAQFGNRQCERLASSVDNATLLKWSSLLLPHLNALLTDLFGNKQTIATILGVKESDLLNLVWRNALAHNQEFVSAQHMLTAVLQLNKVHQHFDDETRRQQAMIANLQTALTSTSQQFKETLNNLQLASPTPLTESAKTILASIKQFQNLSASERLDLVAKLNLEQKLAIVDTLRPDLAKVLRELVRHPELLREWLRSALPNIDSSTLELQHGLLHYVLAHPTQQRRHIGRSNIREEITSALASVTRLNNNSINEAFELAPSSSLEERLRKALPTVLPIVQSSGLDRASSRINDHSDINTTNRDFDSLVKPQVRPQLLRDFRDWQQGRLSLQELALEVQELRQVLQWWVNQASNLTDELRASFLDQAFNACDRCYSPTRLLESILETVRSRMDLSISELEELLAWELNTQQQASRIDQLRSQSPSNLSASEFDFLLDDEFIVPNNKAQTAAAGTDSDRALEVDLARIEQEWATGISWLDIKKSIQALLFSANAEQLHVDDLHRLLKLYGQRAMQAHEYAEAFLHSVEKHALRASNPRQFLHLSLQCLVSDQEIDLEEMLFRDQFKTDTKRDTTSSARNLLQKLEELLAVSKVDDAADQHFRAWMRFLQQDNVRRYLDLYLSDVIQRVQTSSLSFSELQRSIIAQETRAHLMQASPIQILALLRAVVQYEAQHQTEVVAPLLLSHFGLTPDLLPYLLEDTDNRRALKQALELGLDRTDQTKQVHAPNTTMQGKDATTSIHSPLPKGWREALPQLLAEAFLAANLNKLDLVWQELTRHHQQDLLQAQKRYLHQTNTRDRLLRSESHEKLLDLVAAFSLPVKELLIDLRAAGSSMIKIWRLSLSEEQLFSALLNKTYHELFTTQLVQKTTAQHLVHLLQAMRFWPKETQTQALYLRALYFSLGDSKTSLLYESLGSLCHQDRVASLLTISKAQYDDHDASFKQIEDSKISNQILTSTLIDGDNTAPTQNLFTSPWEALEATFQAELETTSLLQTQSFSVDSLLNQAVAAISSSFDADARTLMWSKLAKYLSSEEETVDNTEAGLYLAEQMRSLREKREAQGDPSAADSALTVDATAPNSQLERLAILLRSNAPLLQTEKLWIRLCIEHIISSSAQVLHRLEKLLSEKAVIERLVEAVDTVNLEFLFHRCHPRLHQHVHALCRAIEETQQWKLYEANGFLSTQAWRAIYWAMKEPGASQSALSFSKGVLNTLSENDDAANTNTEGLDTKQRLRDLLAYAKEQRAQEIRKRLAEEEEKKRALQSIKKKARLLGEEEEIPYGESNVLNAGMVIIAPYIQRLFNILELTRDGTFVNDGAAERAVHILQYVVTGEQATPEYRLALNKLLCGIHGGVPIIASIDITDHEINVTEQMLMGVIANWSALGKTSIAGLRQTFLVREGQLSFVDESWQLRIPSSSFDMLLDRLPWSFAMIKFPWMRAPLHVTWR
ncbi:hypothetical protein H8K35_18260 [Undibacterium sp. LX40W]|uniref:Uncharacterized protein n=1 Tax=Undibacterium nitidum TaxID=2762298 RepID=A0A923HSU3_9BURK|nr:MULTISPECIES: contractile injection system tape measure protein [Undibacterium]MBC3883343.1 hypothetical protein [Undibacterium nitidum]MBC3893625.1 hypothetical protein [Undibacterium sp. LX40W]